jgi:archaellum component FlaF (FlaF/FlaG flagellin family)
MTNYPVAADKLAKHNILMVANTEDTVTFADNPQNVEILTDGAAKIYVTTDGTAATVAGDNTYIIPAVASSRIVKHWNPTAAVRLISPGTPTVSVTRV